MNRKRGRKRVRAVARVVGPAKRGMNGLETRFAELLKLRLLAGEILSFEFEGLSFKIGHQMRYKPDFAVLNSDSTMTCYETKGFWRADARMRIKLAANAWPAFRFIGVMEEGGRNSKKWVYEIFDPYEEGMSDGL